MPDGWYCILYHDIGKFTVQKTISLTSAVSGIKKLNVYSFLTKIWKMFAILIFFFYMLTGNCRISKINSLTEFGKKITQDMF